MYTFTFFPMPKLAIENVNVRSTSGRTSPLSFFFINSVSCVKDKILNFFYFSSIIYNRPNR